VYVYVYVYVYYYEGYVGCWIVVVAVRGDETKAISYKLFPNAPQLTRNAPKGLWLAVDAYTA